MFICVLSLLVAIFPAPVLAAPSVSLDPDEGLVGQKVTVSGRYFDAYEDVDIYFAENDANIGGDIDSYDNEELKTGIYVGSNGRFSTSITIPKEIDKKDVEEGRYSLCVTYYDEDEIVGIARFRINKIEGDLDLDPAKGYVGEEVTVDGQDFNNYEDEYIYLYFTDESFDPGEEFDKTTVTYANLTNVRVDSDGEFSTRFDVPSKIGSQGVLADRYYVVAADSDGIVVNTQRFTIILPPSAIQIAPDEGIVGTAMVISGIAFVPGSTVTIFYDGTKVGTATSDTTGKFTHNLSVPKSAAGGHIIQAEDAQGANDEVDFRVIPNLAITPGRVAPGTEATLRGTGFAPITEVTIYSETSQVIIATAITDPHGSFVTSCNARDNQAGSHSFTATDQQSNKAISTFTIIPLVTVMPKEVAIGAEVNVNGFGFGANRSMTVTFDDVEVASTTTDAHGNFTISFVVDQSQGGNHTVTAVDALGNQGLVDLIIETIIPEPPQMVKPVPGETIGWFGGQTPMMDWSDVNDPSGVTYTLEIADKEDFAAPILTRNDLDISQYTLIKVEALDIGTYYWRVKSIDGAYNESEWSDPFEFKVGSFPTWLSKRAFISLIVLLFAIAAGVAYLRWAPPSSN